MRKSIYAILSAVAIVAVVASCNVKDTIKNAIKVSFTTDAVEGQFTVPPITNTSTEQSLGALTYNLNLDSTIKAETNNEFSISDINTVKLQSAVASIQNPDSANNVANFESAILRLTSSNAPEINLQIDNILDTYATKFVFPVADLPNLQGYLSGGNYTYELRGKLRRPTTKDLTVNLRVGILVEKN